MSWDILSGVSNEIIINDLNCLSENWNFSEPCDYKSHVDKIDESRMSSEYIKKKNKK